MSYRILPSGFGYLGISCEMIAPQNFEAQMNEAITAMADTPGIVVDVRGNKGGMDIQSAAILGYFMEGDDSSQVIYEKVSYSNSLLQVAQNGKNKALLNGTNPKDYAIFPEGQVNIIFSGIKKYKKPLVVLIN